MTKNQLRRIVAIGGSLAVMAVGGSYAAGAFASGGSHAPPVKHVQVQPHSSSSSTEPGEDATEHPTPEPGEDPTEHATPEPGEDVPGEDEPGDDNGDDKGVAGGAGGARGSPGPA